MNTNWQANKGLIRFHAWDQIWNKVRNQSKKQFGVQVWDHLWELYEN